MTEIYECECDSCGETCLEDETEQITRTKETYYQPAEWYSICLTCMDKLDLWPSS